MHYTTSCNTQSSAREDGSDYRPKHVELIGIINKPLFLHLVGVCMNYINDARSNKYQIDKYVITDTNKSNSNYQQYQQNMRKKNEGGGISSPFRTFQIL